MAGGHRGDRDAGVADGLVDGRGGAAAAGPIRPVFMLTVIGQVRPWLTPSRTLAVITQAQMGPRRA
jgi:hypothetical protein